MCTSLETAGLLPVTDDQAGPEIERGHEIKRRRRSLGIKSQHALAQLTEKFNMKVSRDAIMAAESGRASRDTYERLTAFFDRFEEETGHDEPDVEPADSGLVTFRVSGNFGVDVVVQGPVADVDELEKAVERLIRKMRDTD